jgi:uncharacterized protein YjdB
MNQQTKTTKKGIKCHIAKQAGKAIFSCLAALGLALANVTCGGGLDSVANILVHSVSLDRISLSVGIEQTHTLTATVNPQNAGNQAVWWESSNTNVATVSGSGQNNSSGSVRGVGSGTATITAWAGGEKVKATCEVRVTIPAHSLNLNKQATTLSIGNIETLVATVLPANADNKTVYWSTSNRDIVTVQGVGSDGANGVIMGIAAGTATITARIINSTLTATCTVTVGRPASP